MTSLYAWAESLNYLVVGTDNAAELYLGYFTKYGDGGADLLPIANLSKAEVKRLLVFLNAPPMIINQKPSADLWAGQSDEQELGFSYHDVDLYLQEPSNVSLEIKKKIETWHQATRHKRLLPAKPPKTYGS